MAKIGHFWFFEKKTVLKKKPFRKRFFFHTEYTVYDVCTFFQNMCTMCCDMQMKTMHNSAVHIPNSAVQNPGIENCRLELWYRGAFGVPENHFWGPQEHFWSQIGHFWGRRDHFWDPKTFLRPKNHFWGPKYHFWGPKDHYWGKNHFWNPYDHFRGLKDHICDPKVTFGSQKWSWVWGFERPSWG